MTTISPATSPADYAAFADLIGEYLQWSRQRYAAHPWFVEKVFGHQSLDAELQDLPGKYGPPQGLTLLARRDGQVCGAGALRRLPDGSCEMKRLFVPDAWQGHGIGRALCAALIVAARDQGYVMMRLDTGNLLSEAIAMYRTFGFRTSAPHHEYPPELLPFMVFMELPLTPADGASA